MWRKGNPHALWVRTQIGAATVGSNMELPQKIKNGSALWPSNSTSGNISEETQNNNSKNICTTMFIGALLTYIIISWNTTIESPKLVFWSLPQRCISLEFYFTVWVHIAYWTSCCVCQAPKFLCPWPQKAIKMRPEICLGSAQVFSWWLLCSLKYIYICICIFMLTGYVDWPWS